MFSGTLTCAIRGFPRPSIRWFRNSIEVTNQPRFRASWGQGIIQLEINRSSLSDAGTYTCFAANAFGEAAVTADVFVRQPTIINPPA
jgi:hypothetical protein